MHLYRLETIGNLDRLGAREEAMPVPSAGEVLIRVKASALNFRDLAILLGKSPFRVRVGVVPISDAAGEVEAVGPDVSTLKAGDYPVLFRSHGWQFIPAEYRVTCVSSLTTSALSRDTLTFRPPAPALISRRVGVGGPGSFSPRFRCPPQ